jgi:hypothetical protein
VEFVDDALTRLVVDRFLSGDGGRISNIEQGTPKDEVLLTSDFDIPCSIFDIPVSPCKHVLSGTAYRGKTGF